MQSDCAVRLCPGNIVCRIHIMIYKSSKLHIAVRAAMFELLQMKYARAQLCKWRLDHGVPVSVFNDRALVVYMMTNVLT